MSAGGEEERGKKKEEEGDALHEVLFSDRKESVQSRLIYEIFDLLQKFIFLPQRHKVSKTQREKLSDVMPWWLCGLQRVTCIRGLLLYVLSGIIF